MLQMERSLGDDTLEPHNRRESRVRNERIADGGRADDVVR